MHSILMNQTNSLNLFGNELKVLVLVLEETQLSHGIAMLEIPQELNLLSCKMFLRSVFKALVKTYGMFAIMKEL